MIGGSIFTKIGYHLMNKYNIGYVVIFIVFGMDIANVVSEIYYGIVTAIRYGHGILISSTHPC